MSKAIYPEDFYLKELDQNVTSKVLTGMVKSLLPGLRSLFTKGEYGKLEGALRRNDSQILNSEFLSEKLRMARSGEIDISTELFRNLYQFVSLLKKVPEMGSDLQCKAAGFNKLREGEEQCRETNGRILAEGFPLDSIFGEVQDLIKTILGPLPSNFLDTDVTFGPGSTVNVDNRKFNETSEFFKLTDKLIVPRRARTYLAAHMSYQAGWIDGLKTHYHLNDTIGTRLNLEYAIFDKHFHVVDDSYPNRIGFVPKNKDEHRSIGIELNGLVILQKVLGNAIRKCLKAFGLNLDTQGRNRHFARFAKTFGLATIDLKNASNTIAFRLIKALFPYDWFQVMSAFRSTHGTCPSLAESEEIAYEMFSSMGNGFTFEMESLVFFATAICQVKKDQNVSYKEALRQVAVFGDDIIVPQTSAKNVIASLEMFGFTINTDKSFLKGNFFESCGHDYFNCQDVRPFFLKRQLLTTRDLYFLCNSLLFKIIKTESDFLSPAYAYIMKIITSGPYLPGPLHFTVKTGFEDLNDDLEACLRVPLEYAQKHGSVRFDINMFAWTYAKYSRVSIEVPLSKNRQYAVQSARYMTFLRGNLGGIAVLRGDTETVKKRSLTSQWDGNTSKRSRNLLHDIFL